MTQKSPVPHFRYLVKMIFGLVMFLSAFLLTASGQADKATELVVEARLAKPGEGSKYHWITIEIRKVLVPVEGSKMPVPTSLEVVQLYNQPQLPTNWCKVRLEPLEGSLHPNAWKVVDWQKLAR